MAAQLAPVARLPVYRSARRVSIFPSLPDDRIEDVGPVLRYSRSECADEKITVHLQDRTIDDVDYVLFGTGYYPDVPYLRVLEPLPVPATRSGPGANSDASTPRPLVPLTGRHVQPARVPSLYRHVLYAHNTSLAFIGALISFIPFAMADLTSTWLAVAWSPPNPHGSGEHGGIDTHSTTLVPPTTERRLTDERARLHALRQLRSETPNPSNLLSFHFLGPYELGYAQQTRAEVVRVAPEFGEVLAPWDDAQDARRFTMYATKLDSLYVLAGREKA